MMTYEGRCPYCGTIELVMAESQEVADAIIGKKCSCGGYEREGRLLQLNEAIRGTVGEDCSIYDIQPLEEGVVEFLYSGGILVVENRIQKITVDVDGATVKISVSPKGVVKVERKESSKVSAEC